MSNIAKVVGQRIRNYRTQKGLSQDKLAELSGFHPTYIGQLERGEKNATLESIEKITSALQISLSTLFERIDDMQYFNAFWVGGLICTIGQIIMNICKELDEMGPCPLQPTKEKKVKKVKKVEKVKNKKDTETETAMEDFFA